MLGYVQDPRLVHEGSHSLVYRGRLPDDRPVVVKLTRDEYPSPRRLAVLRREHQLLSRIDSPAVVRPVGIVQDGHRLALLLADEGGCSLDRLSGGRQGLPLDRFFRVAIDIAEGLAALHGAGVLHLDVKPSNVIVHPDSWRAQLIDLSLVSLGTRTPRSNGKPPRLEGSLPYLSPEQTGRLNRSVDVRSDLYSLGATLYELLVGSAPFQGSSPSEFVHCHLAITPVPAIERRSDCPPAVSSMLDVLLSKDPDDRYQSAWGVRADLLRAQEAWRAASTEPFHLRTDDLHAQFGLTDQLYGRRADESALRAAVERAAEGGTEVMLIAGPSGVGKSALIHHVSGSLVRREGHFIEGKFDQFRRNVPYDSLVQAFRQLIRQVLAEEPAALAEWRSAVEDAVGVNGQVLIDVIPEFELLLGPQAPAAPLAPRAALNRFGLVFGNFISVFARPRHPLVVFLDDLQWADAASLELLARLVTDPRHRGLLVVGAYRDNEVSAQHRLTGVLDRIERDGGRLTTLTLSPLSVASVAHWLGDSFGGSGPALQRRARMVVAKTDGNPFFVTRFIAALMEHGALMRGPDGWTWDDDAAARQSFTENVVQLLGRRLQALPPATQEILQIAACVGARSTLHGVALAAGRSTEEAARALAPAIGAGFLIPRGESLELIAEWNRADAEDAPEPPDCELDFLHDQVQQVAYASIPSDRREAIHLDVGRRLLADADADEHLFEIVRHLGAAVGSIDDGAELVRLAELHLRAARQARRSGAYGPAANLLEAALSFLPETDLPAGLKRSLLLERGSNRAQLSLRDEATEDFEAALACSSTVLERVEVREEWIQGLLFAADYLGVLHQGAAALEELGEQLPDGPDARAAAGLELLEAGLADIDLPAIEALSTLPPISDPHAERVAAVLSAISPSAHMTDGTEHWFVWVAFRGLKLFREHGNTSWSCHGYSLVGMTLCAIGDVERGYAFHRLAVQLAERYADPDQLCRTLVCFGFHQPWRDSVQATTETARRAWHYSLEAGDRFNAQWSSVTLLRSGLHSGTSLLELRDDAASCGEFLALRGPEMAALASPMLDLCDHFSGAAAEDGPYADAEHAWFEAVESTENEALRVWSQVPGLMALLLDGRDAEVVTLARRIWPRYEVFRRFGDGGELHFLHGLAAAREAHRTEQSPEEARSQLSELEVWAKESPRAYGAKAELLRAAIALADADVDGALGGYLRAVRLAEENAIHHVTALASLAAAGIQGTLGRDRYAHLHRRDARQAFLRWGALRLATEVREGDPTISLPTTSTITASPAWTATWSSSGAGARTLDLEALLSAADAIASKLDEAELLRRILRVAAENAGADAGVLVLTTPAGRRVRARWQAGESRGLFEALDLPLEDAPFLCLRAVHYVLRTGEPIVLGEVERDARFARDPHVVADQVRSMLVLPLRRGGNIEAVLLLENRLAHHAFTEDRVKLLTTLSSQMVIALENARLVAELERSRDAALDRGEDLEGEVLDRDRALVQARRLRSVVLDALSEGVCGLGPDGLVVLANPAAHELLGAAPGTLLGQNFHEAFHARASTTAASCPVCGGAAAWADDTILVHSDGSSVEVECQASPLSQAAGGIARVLSFRDVGLRREFQEQTLRRRKIEAVGQFVAGLAHEFNNLLTPMRGHLSWLRESEEGGPERRQALEDIESASGRAADLIQQLLAFGRRASVFQVPVDVCTAAAEVVHSLSEDAADHIQLTFTANADALWTRADAQQLQQVLHNLCANAVEALSTPEFAARGSGAVAVHASEMQLSAAEADAAGSGARAGRWIEVRITDDGPGLDEDTQERLFEPFFTTRPLGQGTGLGLAVVLGIVKQHGGWVTVTTEPGAGTTFRVYFPHVEASPDADTLRAPEAGREDARRRILVVDDEPVVRRGSEMILERAGYEVRTAPDGLAALDAAAREGTFDAILLDLSMPGIDGWETLRQLRGNGFDNPIVLTSGFNLPEQAADAHNDLSDGFLPKPFSAADLRGAMEAVLPDEDD
ncbi:MAG: AAA family ATPase [Proteobacteria bacterium]|nr:AAA family ATPase [Pseudomonadota bacterium]